MRTQTSKKTRPSVARPVRTQPAAVRRADAALSPRELELLNYLSCGKTREEAAIILGLSLDTVKHHTKNIRAKLAVNNMVFAVRRAFELGVLKPMALVSLGDGTARFRDFAYRPLLQHDQDNKEETK